MKYKLYKNPIKYIKEIKQKASSYEALFQYLLSCRSIDIDYQEVKNGNNVVLARYPKKYIVNYNVDLNKLYGLIGIETGIKE